jgi:hypothetical protein
MKKKYYWIVVVVAIVLIAGCTQTISNVSTTSFCEESFPSTYDINADKITLQRTDCYGLCSVYSLSIFGNGTVVYNGQKNIAVQGIKISQISQDKINELINEFKKVDYFCFQNSYTQPITDLQTTITSITIDGKTKIVSNYAGESDKLRELENKIDEIAICEVSGTEYKCASFKTVMIDNCIRWENYNCSTKADANLSQVEWYIENLCKLQNQYHNSDLDCSNLKKACNQIVGNQTPINCEEELSNNVDVHTNEMWRCDAQTCKIWSISSDIECSNNPIWWGVDIYKDNNFMRKCEASIAYGWGCNWYLKGKIDNSAEQSFTEGEQIKVFYWCKNISSVYEPQNNPSVEVKYINYTVNLTRNDTSPYK